VTPALLQVRELSVRYPDPPSGVQALDRVSFDLEEGETLAVVGESGSGKSTLALAIQGLLPSPPADVLATSVRFAGRELARLSAKDLRKLLGVEIATVFQDPAASLCPWLTVGEQVGEILEVHRGASARDARRAAASALGEVGIADPESRLDAYPHELSGGMRQRVTIAMALLLGPKLLVADEPTSSLDATVQAGILDLFREARRRHGTAILLVTHSLGVVAAAADRAVVLSRGRVVEAAGVRELFRAPAHEYTRELLASVPGAR